MIRKFIIIFFATMGLTISFIPSVIAEENFSDIKSEKYYYDSVNALYLAGIVGGYPGGEFGPTDIIQRRHGAILFQRSLSLPVPENYQSILREYYTDVDEDGYYAKPIASVTPEIFKGGNGKFYPTSSLTREEMATTLVRALNLTNNEQDVSINLTGVHPVHQDNVKIFAQHKITNQLDNYRPKDTVTRGEFVTFLQRALLAASPHTITVKDGITFFDRLVEITLLVENPSQYKVYVSGEELVYKDDKFVGVLNATSKEQVTKGLVIIRK